jgi:hypothetical protein
MIPERMPSLLTEKAAQINSTFKNEHADAPAKIASGCPRSKSRGLGLCPLAPHQYQPTEPKVQNLDSGQ